ncbi:MAG: ABC transporter permease [Chloroflexota bacterium]|nr:ABC transporter permease [Chloroflexota bacterium]
MTLTERAEVEPPAGTEAAGRNRIQPRGPGDPTATIIRPSGRWPGLGLAEFWGLRRICLVLARRDLMVRYRQTLIGSAWAIVQPVLLMIVFSIFFGLLGRLPSAGLPYPVFFLLGLVPWQMVAKILNQGSASVTANAALVTRVYFPRTYFPVSVALASLVDLALASIALAVILLAFGVMPGVAIVVLPIFVAIAWMTALGVAFWLSAINVTYRDIVQLLPFLTQVWMFSSPIIYPATLVPAPYHVIYFLNPLALVVSGFRWAIGGAPAPPAEAWLLGSVVSAAVLASGYIFFRRREATFADVL